MNITYLPHDEYLRFKKWKALWWGGWAVSALLVITLIYCVAIIKTQRAELEQFGNDIQIIKNNVRDSTIHLEEAWEHNKTLADAILAWGEAEKEKQEAKGTTSKVAQKK